MKRSEINQAYQRATISFRRAGWALPPNAHWDITDFGLGNFSQFGLSLINLASEPEYCEKIMYAWKGQTTPCHTHVKKKEDIICRSGSLAIRLWSSRPLDRFKSSSNEELTIRINGVATVVAEGAVQLLESGCRITLPSGIWHTFTPTSDECVIGEVSTANDDFHDNIFEDVAVGRFPGIDEDEPAQIHLLSE